MPSIPQILLRGLQLLCVIILTGLVAGAIDVQHFFNDSVNYAMFTTVFSWIVVIYGLSAAFVESLAHPIILLVLDGFAIGFNFIAGVTLAARLGAHSCSNSVSCDTFWGLVRDLVTNNSTRITSTIMIWHKESRNDAVSFKLLPRFSGSLSPCLWHLSS